MRFHTARVLQMLFKDLLRLNNTHLFVLSLCLLLSVVGIVVLGVVVMVLRFCC